MWKDRWLKIYMQNEILESGNFGMYPKAWKHRSHKSFVATTVEAQWKKYIWSNDLEQNQMLNLSYVIMWHSSNSSESYFSNVTLDKKNQFVHISIT